MSFWFTNKIPKHPHHAVPTNRAFVIFHYALRELQELVIRLTLSDLEDAFQQELARDDQLSGTTDAYPRPDLMVLHQFFETSANKKSARVAQGMRPGNRMIRKEKVFGGREVLASLWSTCYYHNMALVRQALTDLLHCGFDLEWFALS
jgi:hypothetical protein